MDECHDSLCDDFEVTNSQLDSIVQIARQTEGCLEARMTGAGFGGCATALVRSNSSRHFSAEIASEYKRRTGLTPQIYLCRPSDGASLE